MNGLVRRLRNGGVVRFDASLRHVATKNRQGDSTTFYYNPTVTTQLDSITLPVPSGSTTRRTFTLLYSGSPARLSQIRGPAQTGSGNRDVGLTHDSNGKLLYVVEPTGDSVRFMYASYTSTAVLTGRINRMRDTTLYTYDGWGGVSQVTVRMRTASAIVTTQCPVESRSLATCSGDNTANTPLAPGRVTTRLDGPRSDISDVTRFFVGRFGAPDSVVDASGARVRLVRANSGFPALVTEMTDAAGLVTRTAYNARGLPDSVTIVSPFGGSNTVSRFKWHSKWDMSTSMRSPTGNVDTLSIDTNTGNRLWQRRGLADSTQITFGYDAHNRLTTVTNQQSVALATLTYESVLGNLWKSQRPLGAVTEALQNAIGADTAVLSHTDTLLTSHLRVRSSTVFDVMGRPTQSITHAPGVPWSLSPVGGLSGTSDSVRSIVVTHYDIEGRPDSVRRFSKRNTTWSDTALTTTKYDPAGRPLVSREYPSPAGDSTVYDPSGNAIRIITRRSHIIAQTFDPLNRLVTRSAPTVTYQRTHCGECRNVDALYWPQMNDSVFAPDFGSRIAPYMSVPDLIIPAELTVFGYDAAGRMVQADNPDVRIRRGYFPNGALQADTSWVRSYDIGAVEPFAASRRSVLTYTYDLAGRRVGRTDHTGGTQSYAYDALGQLASTTDQAAGGSQLATTFSYDAQGRLAQQAVPSASTLATWTYDVEGRPTIRAEEGFADTIVYDPRGKRLRVRGKTTMMDAAVAGSVLAYDALGQVLASANEDSERPLVTDEIRMDGHGNQLVRHANRLSSTVNTEARDSSRFVGHRLVERVGEHKPDNRTSPNGLEPAIKIADSLGISYDFAGNVTYQIQVKRRGVLAGSGVNTARDSVGHSWSYNFYDAGQRLRAAQRTSMSQNATNLTTFDEYWYDALGRRVAVRTRVDSVAYCPMVSSWPSPSCQQQFLRTVWDGDQVLLEHRGVGGWQEVDGNLGYEPGGPWYGTVRYTQTGAIDAPVIVWIGSTPRVLHRNWRGTVAGATLANGNADTETVWPAAVSDVWLSPDSRQSPPQPNKWLGSLVTEGKDATGTLYRRNRYYDPASGRFTQEDPIGLAGGPNLYGYAGGDPINFGDPFGLDCESKDGGRRSCRLTWSTADTPDSTVTAATLREIQAIADEAELDLVLSSGRRAGACPGSLHNCGRAIDISGVMVNGTLVDFGQGRGPGAVNVNALRYAGTLQGVASGRENVAENLGPWGMWSSRARGTAMAPFYTRTVQAIHYNHVHIGVHP